MGILIWTLTANRVTEARKHCAPTGRKPRVLRWKLLSSDRDNDRSELRWTTENSNEGKNAETVISSPLSAFEERAKNPVEILKRSTTSATESDILFWGRATIVLNSQECVPKLICCRQFAQKSPLGMGECASLGLPPDPFIESKSICFSYSR